MITCLRSNHKQSSKSNLFVSSIYSKHIKMVRKYFQNSGFRFCSTQMTDLFEFSKQINFTGCVRYSYDELPMYILLQSLRNGKMLYESKCQCVSKSGIYYAYVHFTLIEIIFVEITSFLMDHVSWSYKINCMYSEHEHEQTLCYFEHA